MIATDSATGPGRVRRRDVLRAAAAVGAMAGLGAPHVARAAPAPRVLKMGYIYARASQLGAGADEFTRRIEAATGGAWRIEHYPGGALGGDVELLEGLREGEVDVAFVTAVAFAGVVPAFGVFDLPFLFRGTAHARAVFDGPIGQEYLSKFRERDLVALAWGEIGVRHLTNASRPIRTPEDLRGLRLRVPQSEVMLRCFRQLGVEAAPLAFPALYGALESGRFDGQENPIATIRAAHLERVQKHLTLSGHIYSGAVIFVSKDVWDELGPAERDALADAARAGGSASRRAAERAEHDGVEALQAAGLDVVAGLDTAAFLAALEPTWSGFARLETGTGRGASARRTGRSGHLAPGHL